MRKPATIDHVEVDAYRIPTEQPESDGTYCWDATTMVVAHVSGGGATGMGYSYADAAAARLIRGKLAAVVAGRDPFDIPWCWKTRSGMLRSESAEPTWTMTPRLRGHAGQSAYCGAKHGVRGFTDSLRCELRHQRSKVHITMVQMPALNTPQFGWVKSRLPHKVQPITNKGGFWPPLCWFLWITSPSLTFIG